MFGGCFYALKLRGSRANEREKEMRRQRVRECVSCSVFTCTAKCGCSNDRQNMKESKASKVCVLGKLFGVIHTYDVFSTPF